MRAQLGVSATTRQKRTAHSALEPPSKTKTNHVPTLLVDATQVLKQHESRTKLVKLRTN
jgi:hypothetical protein